MNKYKILGLTFLLALSVGVNAQQKQAEAKGKGQIVMTKEELKSFLKMVAEKRLEQLQKMESQNQQSNTVAYVDVYDQPRKRNVQKKSCKSCTRGQNGEGNLSYQIQRVNDRLDNLMLALIGKGGGSSTVLATGLTPDVKVPHAVDNNSNSTNEQILALEKKMDSLKSIKENVVEESSTDVYISPERRSVLEELLAKYKNFKRQVFFANNSYAVSQSDLAYIDGVVRVLKQNPELSVVLVGYASALGTPEYNKQLSMERAESVAKSITSRGISKNRIISGFYGIDKEATPAKARRVDMTVVIK